MSYKWKLPRIDLLCLNSAGRRLREGRLGPRNPAPALAPDDLLPWPRSATRGSASPPLRQRRPVDHLRPAVAGVPPAQAHERLLELERIKSAIDAREPVAKLGMFVDPFISDFYRDAGEVQTASVGEGVLELSIEPTFNQGSLTAPVTLDWTEEIIIQQERSTSCMKINPYQNFEPLPAAMSLNPAADFWTEQQTM
ncbi:MAG: DUF4815 domain-containing protein [Devosia sp.]|nr:DUF4815 domain-containing protein [Devosia sp.]